MDILGLAGTVAIVALIISIGWMILSAYMCYWAYKRKGVVGLLLALFFNWVGWIVVACLPKDDNSERERERERESLINNKVKLSLWQARSKLIQ